MEVTRKRFIALVGASVASAGLYVVGIEKEKQAVKMDIKITAQGKV